LKVYTVYRFDYATQMRTPIGNLVDHRENERRNNIEDMLRLAQKVFGFSSIDSHIYVTPANANG
jgi:hypothetical protein